MAFVNPTKTVRLEVIGETTYEKFEGEFTFKILLTMTEQHDLELAYSRLLGDLENPSQNLTLIARIRSNLRFYIINCPIWWKDSDGGAQLFDFNVLLELQTLLNQSISEFRENQKKKAEEKNS